jgi:hypothetical protein
MLWLAGCGGAPEEPHGTPVVLEIDWVSTTGRTIVYAAASDAATTASVPGGAGEIDFIFDRRLDGTRIEDVVGATSVPKADPPITVTWDGMNGASDADGGADGSVDGGVAGDFSDLVYYSSTPVPGGPVGSSYVYLRPHTLGFPSATAVKFHLDLNGLTSAYGEPIKEPEYVTVMVAPMVVLPDDPSSSDALPTFAQSAPFSVRFSNRLAPAAALAPFAHARVDGVDLPVVLGIDGQDPTRLLLSAAPCLGGWPSGAVVNVTFDAGLPDAFGVPTSMALIGGSFMVAGTALDAGTADAACGD